MNRFDGRWMALAGVILAGIVTAMQPLPAKEISQTRPASKLIDSFDRKPPAMKYLTYGTEQVSVQEGYGVYYDKAEIHLSRVTVNGADKALRIKYKLPQLYDWGNWVSIRREFAAPEDFGKCEGVELRLRVEEPSEVHLRITLCDVESRSKMQHGSDELWWYDLPADVLKTSPGKWTTLRAPFKKFALSYGAGTRHNDGRQDFSKVVAFEINVISKAGEQAKGTIQVSSLRGYAK